MSAEQEQPTASGRAIEAEQVAIGVVNVALYGDDCPDSLRYAVTAVHALARHPEVLRELAGVPASEAAGLEDRYGETYVWHQFPGCQPGYHQCADGESIDYIERERGGKLRPAL